MKTRFILLILLLAFGIAGAMAKKQALLIGISNYNENVSGFKPLNGANDVDLLSGKLKKKGFTVKSLINSKATKKNITKALAALVASTAAGDEVYLHFSGHGQPVPDMNNDEPDKYDQSFVCYDAYYTPRYTYAGKPYMGQNHLIDDELFPYLNQLKKKVGKNGRVMVVFDSCYSEGNDRGELKEDEPAPDSDLAIGLEEDEPASDSVPEVEFSDIVRGTADYFQVDKNSKDYLGSIKAPGAYSTGGELIVISACGRNQRNWETKEIRTQKNYGALSYCIGKLLDDNIPLAQWKDIFSTRKYKRYKVFRDTQHPVAERY